MRKLKQLISRGGHDFIKTNKIVRRHSQKYQRINNVKRKVQNEIQRLKIITKAKKLKKEKKQTRWLEY